MTIDNALLRFKTSLKAALELGDSKVANVFSWQFLCVRPDQKYLQISNFDTDVNFGGDYKAELIGFCGTVYKDITGNTFIYQGYSSITGKQNIGVELVNIGDMYPNWGKPVILKITHTVGDLVIYSNPFHVSYTKKDILRLDYRGYGTNNGVDYTNFNFMQSFGVKGWFNKPIDETETTKYLQESGNTISSEPTISIAHEYTFEHLTAYNVKALARWFRSPLFYLNGVRHTANNLTIGDREGNSNFYQGVFTGYPNEADTYTPVLQIAPILTFTPIYPVGIYTLAGLLPKIQGQFNYPITLGVGTLRVYTDGGTLVNTFTQDDIVITGNSFEINQVAATELGKYYIKFDESLFINVFGQSGYLVDWKFEIADGEFDADEFDNDEFLTV